MGECLQEEWSVFYPVGSLTARTLRDGRVKSASWRDLEQLHTVQLRRGLESDRPGDLIVRRSAALRLGVTICAQDVPAASLRVDQHSAKCREVSHRKGRYLPYLTGDPGSREGLRGTAVEGQARPATSIFAIFPAHLARTAPDRAKSDSVAAWRELREFDVPPPRPKISTRRVGNCRSGYCSSNGVLTLCDPEVATINSSWDLTVGSASREKFTRAVTVAR